MPCVICVNIIASVANARPTLKCENVFEIEKVFTKPCTYSTYMLKCIKLIMSASCRMLMVCSAMTKKRLGEHLNHIACLYSVTNGASMATSLALNASVRKQHLCE